MASSAGDAVREQRAQQAPSLVRYVAVWVALLVLTATTFGASRVDLGEWNLPVALVLACTKGSLVVLFFMHLWDSRGANRVVLAIGLFFMLLLMAGVMGDMSTRFPLARPPGPSWLPGQSHSEGGRGADRSSSELPFIPAKRLLDEVKARKTAKAPDDKAQGRMFPEPKR